MKKMYPDFVYDRVEEIPLNFFEANRIKAVMFDMDNTLVGSDYILNKNVKSWIKSLKKQGIKVCILSNSFKTEKVKQIAKQLGVNYINMAMKPLLKGFKKAEALLATDKDNMAIVGDQIFTDILGGNSYGIKTILVSPIENKEAIITRIKRPVETMIIKKRLKKKVGHK